MSKANDKGKTLCSPISQLDVISFHWLYWSLVLGHGFSIAVFCVKWKNLNFGGGGEDYNSHDPTQLHQRHQTQSFAIVRIERRKDAKITYFTFKGTRCFFPFVIWHISWVMWTFLFAGERCTLVSQNKDTHVFYPMKVIELAQSAAVAAMKAWAVNTSWGAGCRLERNKVHCLSPKSPCFFSI